MARGAVKWFNSQKGYGFIEPQGGGGRDVFVHISAVERAGLPGLNEGQVVEYEEVSNRGKTSAEISRSRAKRRAERLLRDRLPARLGDLQPDDLHAPAAGHRVRHRRRPCRTISRRRWPMPREKIPQLFHSRSSTPFDKRRTSLIRRRTKGNAAPRAAAIAWPNDERNHCGEKRKKDYDQNGFHTSSLAAKERIARRNRRTTPPIWPSLVDPYRGLSISIASPCCERHQTLTGPTRARQPGTRYAGAVPRATQAASYLP
jgi:CspA family cold shock protein